MTSNKIASDAAAAAAVVSPFWLPDAVITEPNRYGRTLVWPIKGSIGTTIRCFMPGSMT
jgi:hypothetical protein